MAGNAEDYRRDLTEKEEEQKQLIEKTGISCVAGQGS
jgi:hypothetical protein